MPDFLSSQSNQLPPTNPNLDLSFQNISLEDPSAKYKQIVLLILVVILLLVTPTAAYFLFQNQKGSDDNVGQISPTPTETPSDQITPTILPTAPITPVPNNVSHISVLLLGRGGDGHSGGGLTDSITQLVFYPSKLKVSLIGIPRDTYVEAGQPKRWMKINHSFVESPANTKLAVEAITGIRVDHFVIVDFNGFIKLIDSLGGITVDVSKPFTDSFYPIKGQEDNTCGMSAEQMTEVHQKYSGFNLEKQFTCRYETLVFSVGPTKMDGATALKYLRSRHSGVNGSDFARIERSAGVITAIAQNLTQKLATTARATIFNDLKKYVGTDISFDHLLSWKLENDQITQTTIKSIPIKEDLLSNGTSPLGEFILEPKAGRGGWGPIQQYILSNQ
jgi:LCP family protein required for cell wall assembly